MANAYGILEVVGHAAAITALDAMTKAADVKFVTLENKFGGRLATIVVEGSVSSVKAAIESGKIAASRITKPVADYVISRPHEEVQRILAFSAKKFEVK